MTIQSVRLVPYRLPLRDPWPTAEGPILDRHGCLLILEEKDGGRTLGVHSKSTMDKRGKRVAHGQNLVRAGFVYRCCHHPCDAGLLGTGDKAWEVGVAW